MRGRHAQDHLDCGAVEIAAIAAQHEGLAVTVADRLEDRLHEVFEVARLQELGHFLAQAGGAGTLPGKGRGCYSLDGHSQLLFAIVAVNVSLIRYHTTAGKSVARDHFGAGALSVTNSVRMPAKIMQAPPSISVLTVWPAKKCVVIQPSSRPLTICGITTKKLNRPMK